MNNLIEKRIQENNKKIKKLRVNRNIDFGKTVFHISNTVCCNIVANNCANIGFDSNKLMLIPAFSLLLLYGVNVVYVGNSIVKLIEDTRDIHKLKKIRKELLLYNNEKQNQKKK